MSGLVGRITAVHVTHRVRVAPIRSWPRTFMCSCGDWSVQAEDGEEQGCAHVAERVAAELQLTEDVRMRSEWNLLSQRFTDTTERRWVSAWSAVEEKP